MFITALKFIALYFFNNRVAKTKSSLHTVLGSSADYAESRALLIKYHFLEDLERIAKSFVGLLGILAGLVFSGMIGLMWLFAAAWNSPNRELILGVVMLVPLLAGIVLFVIIKNSWKSKPFMNEATELIAQDWKSFRHGLDGTADTSDEANR